MKHIIKNGILWLFSNHRTYAFIFKEVLELFNNECSRSSWSLRKWSKLKSSRAWTVCIKFSILSLQIFYFVWTICKYIWLWSLLTVLTIINNVIYAESETDTVIQNHYFLRVCTKLVFVHHKNQVYIRLGHLYKCVNN